jgi:hypothetical protein
MAAAIWGILLTAAPAAVWNSEGDLAHVASPARPNSLKHRTRCGARRSVARRMRSMAGPGDYRAQRWCRYWVVRSTGILGRGRCLRLSGSTILVGHYAPACRSRICISWLKRSR